MNLKQFIYSLEKLIKENETALNMNTEENKNTQTHMECNHNHNTHIIHTLEKLLTNFKKVENTFSSLIFKESNSTRQNVNILSSGHKINTNNNEANSLLELSHNIEKINIGNLIPLSCGHNGTYTEYETNALVEYIRLSLFI